MKKLVTISPVLSRPVYPAGQDGTGRDGTGFFKGPRDCSHPVCLSLTNLSVWGCQSMALTLDLDQAEPQAENWRMISSGGSEWWGWSLANIEEENRNPESAKDNANEGLSILSVCVHAPIRNNNHIRPIYTSTSRVLNMCCISWVGFFYFLYIIK